MGVFTPKRAVLFVVAVLLGASAFASNPSPRTLARMANDESENVLVLFGGRGVGDQATGRAHGTDETWLWSGGRWVQRFPATRPPGRSAHSMVYDAANDRVVLFGGRQEPLDRNSLAVLFNDTWSWENDNWTAIQSAENPPARSFAGMAYDRARGKVVLYGGNTQDAEGEASSLFDTWELDGSTWTRINNDTTKVGKPLLAYDPVANYTYMIGLVEGGITPVMYRYLPATGSWEQVNATAMPTCVNEGHLVFDRQRGKLIFFGGVCVLNTPLGDEIWEWNGTTWTKLTGGTIPRGVGQAVSYFSLRGETVTFGGTSAFDAVPGSATTLLRGATWFGTFNNNRPAPRSLVSFHTDPLNNNIWLFGGLDEASSFYYNDVWGYRDGQWYSVANTEGPGVGCETPRSTFDTDRGRLVVLCSGGIVFEFDGTTWTKFPDIKPLPATRRWAGFVYDAHAKKSVLFGGYAGTNYRNDTWTWDGTKWTELKIDNDDRPPHRAVHAMWFDPLQQKTIVYGGIGRGNLNQKVTRYDDMYAFDGTKWAKLSVSQTPGARLGPQIGVNPESGKVLLFGGLRSEALDEDSIRQFFDNDTWEWDGAASRWTRLEPATRPDVRQNGGLSWDPTTKTFVLFGGYANGFYLSDVWTWTGTDWQPRVETLGRRRAVR